MPDSPPVTLAQAAELLADFGASYCAIKRWRDDGRFKKVGTITVGKSGNAFLYDLEDIRQAAVVMLKRKNGDVPEGWIGIGQAAKILRTSSKSIGYLATNGFCQAKRITFGSIREKWIFLRELVDQAAANTPISAIGPKLYVSEFPERPLIAARHGDCLAARRELFERAGRILNLQNALARSRRVV